MKIEDFKKKNEEQIFVIDGGEQPPLLKYKKLEEIPLLPEKAGQARGFLQN